MQQLSALSRLVAVLFTLATSCATALAASATPGASRLDWSAIHAAHRAQQAALAQARSSSNGAGTATAPGTKPNEQFVNVDRAYPPSCLQSPLLTLGLYQAQPDQALQAQIYLPGDPLSSDSNEVNYEELDTITVFRVPCSGGTSATLLEIDRPSTVDHNNTRYPTLPAVSVAQGSNNIYVRMANDPNTFLSASYSLTPLVDSSVYVLENYYGNPVQLDYNQAFQLTVDNFITSDPNRKTTYNVPAYNPFNYDETALSLPISGYMSTNWANPNQSGEGVVVQVYDDYDSATRTLALAWFTYDELGLPFWIYGQATFDIGARTLDVPTYYFQNGLFAPATPSADAGHQSWGTITLNFPDCGHMHMQFDGSAAAVQGPAGSGDETFVRVADVNGLVCQ